MPYHDLLSHLYVTGLSALIQSNPILKVATSVLSLESEEDIDVSAQNKFVTLSSPKQIILL